MANHCIDVICLTCGRTWCERGCGGSSGPSLEAISIWKKKLAEWNSRWGRDWKGTKIDDCKCTCGSREIYMD